MICYQWDLHVLVANGQGRGHVIELPHSPSPAELIWAVMQLDFLVVNEHLNVILVIMWIFVLIWHLLTVTFKQEICSPWYSSIPKTASPFGVVGLCCVGPLSNPSMQTHKLSQATVAIINNIPHKWSELSRNSVRMTHDKIQSNQMQ